MTIRDAESRIFSVAFLSCICVFVLMASACESGKGSGQKTVSEAGPPKVVQINDTKIRELLKPNGKPLLVNFWATWCGPCREEFPDLVEIDRQYRGKIDFITISLDFVEEIGSGVPGFLKEMKAEMPTYLLVSEDENALISSISKDWSGALPFTMLVDVDGRAAYVRQGKVNSETLKTEIEKTLNKQQGTSRPRDGLF